MESDDYADRSRRIIAHENTLENNRLQWMLIIQGFLLTALGSFYTPTIPSSIVICIAIVGAITSASSGFHLRHSRRAIAWTLQNFKDKHNDYSGPNVIGLDLRAGSRMDTIQCFLTPPYVLPLLFFVMWILIPCLLSATATSLP